ncbi:competence type IV pilus major pilin ComGC [Anaerobacillus sp. MEB173]|uniref:competence type IV pilus major pilin ComGC n=1 Tax=Anaerobacillus sp. MEB173 TaxID=3383345 RepID=UPI003F92E070
MRMKKKLFKILRGERGFSLIELLIVIAILAVLALLIIPRLTTTLDDAKESTNAANVKLIQSATERFHFDKGRFPTSVDELKTENYIDVVPTDPWERADKGYSINQITGIVEAPEKPTS